MAIHQRLKERLVGAAVLVVLAVIFIPMVLTGPVDNEAITGSNIPAKPEKTLKPKLVPITDTTALDKTEPPMTEKTPPPAQDAIQNEVAAADSAPEPDKAGSSKPAETAAVQPKPDAVTEDNPVEQTREKQVGLSAWVVQLGSFSSKDNADKLNLRLRKSGFPAFVEPIKQDKKTIYRVRVGPELLRSDADKLLANINEKLKLEGVILRYP